VKKCSHWFSCAALIAMIFLCLAWELGLAPLRPGGSALALKVLPLLAPLFGVLRGKRYTFQWAPVLMLLYFCEGVVRAWSERGTGQWLAGVEIALSLIFVVAAVTYVRASRQAVR
jgi:uncharacterized membrane protein